MTTSLHQQLTILASILVSVARTISLTSLLIASSVQAGHHELETVADDLEQPWSVAFLPDGDFLIALRGGKLIRISSDGADRTVISNTPATRFAGQGGYFDVMLDNHFADNKRVFLSFAESDDAGNGTSVISAVLEDDSLSNVTRIYRNKDRIKTSAHYGGRMVQLEDKRLMLTTGDGFNYREASQNRQNHLGKLIELTPDQTGETYSNQVFAYGFRNPQGLYYDTREKTIYLHEHGPKGGDEFNIVLAGKNYGWPATSYGVNYSGARVSPYKSLDGIEEPLKHWTPSVAPSGLTRYNGELFPEWQGSFFIGTLVNRDVRRVTLSEKGIEEEILFSSLDERIRDVRTAPDGHIYLLTDGDSGRLLRIKPAS